MGRPLPGVPGARVGVVATVHPRVHPLGVRHHGPGSARAVRAALEELRPDGVLIEGPPELDAVAGLARSPALVPPVAALVYVPDEPRRAAFYPFATSSPEWVALRWALDHDVPVGFCDLPAVHHLAVWPRRERAPATAAPGPADPLDDDPLDDDSLDDDGPPDAVDPRLRLDPIGALAAAAGFDDPERWWEDVVEHRHHGLDAAAVVLDAMRELRLAAGADHGDPDADDRNLRREAAMRKAIRARVAAGQERIAVVCGAWHAPALAPEAWPSAAADAALLKGLPKVKVAATWVPWTSARLARASGYGAGVTAPGWYDHLFTVPDDQVVVRWLVRVARLLREEGIEVAPASVIDAARLAESLAALRGRPLAGLAELEESSRAVLAGGSDVPLGLVADRLLVGDAIGSVPHDTPMVPLARDLAAAQRRVKLKPAAAAKVLEIDLRRPGGRARSTLLHRLLVLDVPWGEPVDAGRTLGTFKERWRLEWRPELSVAVIEASGAGTTVQGAAAEVVRRRAATADVAELTRLVEAALVAELPDALAEVMRLLGAAAARQHDTVLLMRAVEPLARARRYGDVREVDTATVQAVLDGIVTRVAVGLPASCASLDDDAATAVLEAIDGVQRGIGTTGDPELAARWLGALGAVADQRGVHGVVAGRAARYRFDAGLLDGAGAGDRLSQVLSVGADHRRGAAWIEGFVAGDAALLLHDDALLGVIDGWVAQVPAFVFDDVLPLLRRTFSTFEPAERRQLGEHLRRARSGAVAVAVDDVDPERGRRALPLVRELLGAP
jgi:hypothetical protein